MSTESRNMQFTDGIIGEFYLYEEVCWFCCNNFVGIRYKVWRYMEVKTHGTKKEVFLAYLELTYG